MKRIQLATGSAEGANSAYILPDRHVVVDPGPPDEEWWRALVDGIRGTGLALEDVDHVLVTHWHADHAGLAPRLADRADATLYLHEDDAPLVGAYALERERRTNRDARRLEAWGVPDEIIADVRDGDEPSPMPDSFPVQTVTGGDRIAGVEVLHTPGHTLGHAAFAVDDALFVGDAVLSTYTPNVGGSDTRIEHALSRYLETVATLSGRGEGAYPGHGTEIELAGRIDEIVAHHEERARKVFDVVNEDGPATPWDVARTLFGEMRGVHAKMGAGEAFAHLQHLETTAAVERIADAPVRFDVAKGVGASDVTLRR